MSERGKLGGYARAATLTKTERTQSARRAGMARTRALTPEQRAESARKAARARWTKKRLGEGILMIGGPPVPLSKLTGVEVKITIPARPSLTEKTVLEGLQELKEKRVKIGLKPTHMVVTKPLPNNRKERLAAGLCRACPTPRYVDPETGITSAQWCKVHLDKQREYDQKSWHARK